MNPTAERFIDKYEIVSTLGRGSMGVVYKGRDPEIGRMVAIKTLKTLFLGDDPAGNEALQRFRQESRSAGKLHHKNIVTIFEAGRTTNGSPYIVMEYIEGDSLEAVIARDKPLDPSAVVHYLSQIADAVDYAHSQNVIHRDIKPSNILVDHRHKPYLLDFGVAKLSDTSLTPAGTVVGTPSYMSPEQIRGLQLDGRTDLFSLAVVAFEAFTGVRPFPGDDFTTVVNNIMHKPPLTFRELGSSLSSELETVLKKALSKERNDRYPTATALAAAISQALQVSASATGLTGGYSQSPRSELDRGLSSNLGTTKPLPSVDEDMPGLSATPAPRVQTHDLQASARAHGGQASAVDPMREQSRRPEPSKLNGAHDLQNYELEEKTSIQPSVSAEAARAALKQKTGSGSRAAVAAGSGSRARSSGVTRVPKSKSPAAWVLGLFLLGVIVAGSYFLWKTTIGQRSDNGEDIQIVREPLRTQSGEATEVPVEKTPKRPVETRPSQPVSNPAQTRVPELDAPAVPEGGFTKQYVASMADRDLEALLRWKGAEAEAVRAAVNEAAAREKEIFFTPLRELLNRDSLVIRVAVLKAFRNSRALDQKDVQTAIVKCLSDRDHVIRGFAAIALERVNTPEAQQALERQLGREDNADIRKVIERVLRRG